MCGSGRNNIFEQSGSFRDETQVHGGAGLCQDFGLAEWYAGARALRIVGELNQVLGCGNRFCLVGIRPLLPPPGNRHLRPSRLACQPLIFALCGSCGSRFDMGRRAGRSASTQRLQGRDTPLRQAPPGLEAVIRCYKTLRAVIRCDGLPDLGREPAAFVHARPFLVHALPFSGAG